MEQSIYPLKFNPVLKDKIWGGDKLNKLLGKQTTSGKCGESWEISGVPGDVSIVNNGFLKGNSLLELVEVYLGDLVGDKVYEQFGNQFPLLIKYIDANDVLSIQVHPDDELAKARHDSFGKTEMWYIMQADQNSELIVGFNADITKEKYLEKLHEGKLTDILNSEIVKPGDVYFLPAGRIHAIGAGILLAEIQQTSDVTYRIYDFNRTDDNGNTRELHTEQALDAIDFSYHKNYKTEYKPEIDKSGEVVKCPYFTTNIIELKNKIVKDYIKVDSFVIYMVVEGKTKVITSTGTETISAGETLLIPAILKNVTLEPLEASKLLEVYIT